MINNERNPLLPELIITNSYNTKYSFSDRERNIVSMKSGEEITIKQSNEKTKIFVAEINYIDNPTKHTIEQFYKTVQNTIPFVFNNNIVTFTKAPTFNANGSYMYNCTLSLKQYKYERLGVDYKLYNTDNKFTSINDLNIDNNNFINPTLLENKEIFYPLFPVGLIVYYDSVYHRYNNLFNIPKHRYLINNTDMYPVDIWLGQFFITNNNNEYSMTDIFNIRNNTLKITNDLEQFINNKKIYITDTLPEVYNYNDYFTELRNISQTKTFGVILERQDISMYNENNDLQMQIDFINKLCLKWFKNIQGNILYFDYNSTRKFKNIIDNSEVSFQ